MTASCSVRTIRSAPATGMPRTFKQRIISSVKRLRVRTRIMMSPGRMARPADSRISPSLSQPSIRPAMRSASCAGGLKAGMRSRGASQGSVSGASSGVMVGHISTRPAWPRRMVGWRMGRSAKVRPSLAPGAANTVSTASSIDWEERKDGAISTLRNGFSALSASPAKCSSMAPNWRGSAPWKL